MTASETPTFSFPKLDRPIKLGFMIGGGGRTLVNIADHIDRDELSASIELVIAHGDSIPGYSLARDRDLHIRVLTDDAAINRAFEDAGVDLICMGGYMRWFSIGTHFRNRVINIHPALLPAFGGDGMYGPRVHKAVLAHGCKVSGCTVHFVDDVYDNGPIIVQRTCPVLQDDTADTLAARVFDEECRAYPEAIGLIQAGRTTISGRRVEIRK